MTVPKRFGVLRFFGTLLKVLAWIVLVLGIIGAIGAVVAGAGLIEDFLNQAGLTALTGRGAAGGILAGIGILLAGLFYFLLLYVAGEALHMQLAVEENTRLTAALLLRMHQDGQPESTGYAAGGFLNEPYER
jgi:hypothetical protein